MFASMPNFVTWDQGGGARRDVRQTGGGDSRREHAAGVRRRDLIRQFLRCAAISGGRRVCFYLQLQ